MLERFQSSRVRIKLLAWLFSQPTERFYARALSRQLDENYNAVWRELTDLEEVGLLHSSAEGNVKYYLLNPDFPIYEELKRIIVKTTGLGQELQTSLQEQGSIEWAFVCGSVAAGREDASLTSTSCSLET